MEYGAVIGDAHNAPDATAGGGGYGGNGLSEEDERYPLLLPPDVTLSVRIVVLPVEGETPDGTSFLLQSSKVGSSADKEEEGELFESDVSLDLYTGSSLVNGFRVDPDSPSASGTVDEDKVLSVTSPTAFNGAVYYDLFDPSATSLGYYYDSLDYSLLPTDSLHGLPGCDKDFSTGFEDTVGSYGIMFDVHSAIAHSDLDPDWGEGVEGLPNRFRQVEIYGMELYIRNPVKASFEVHVRTAPDRDPAVSKYRQRYTSYRIASGQTLISRNWEKVASGVIEGLGPDVGSPIPDDAWMKNVIIPPGETVGFYVTVKASPDLRYRNTTIPEGNIYMSDGLLNIAVGRSWGEYPLRGDGTDVYFSPREFSGTLKYRAHDGLCLTEQPSGAPSILTEAPTGSPAAVEHSYLKAAEDEGTCPEASALETTYDDGTGSFGGLFDILAKTQLTLTGIDLNIDWNTGDSTHLLIYARKGSWFGHQNNAESWTHVLVNTTLHRPSDFHNRSSDGPFIPISAKRGSAVVPRSAFSHLELQIGETWSLYVCMSNADFRYTMGTSIGKTHAANPQLRIMEGAGAADYPPFHGGVPEGGGIEYTFYAPRVFNGNLRYDYVAECTSEPPSAAYTTLAPTVTPTLRTSVSYTFYVEHSPNKSKGTVLDDMSYAVRGVLDGFLQGNEDKLFAYANRHELVIEWVEANMVSPTEIGYLCHPAPSQKCSPISIDVTTTHLATANSEEIEFAFLLQTPHLPKLVKIEGYTLEYVGDRAVETKTGITLAGVPDREMEESELELFEQVAREFLDKTATVKDEDGNNILEILSVSVNGQEISTGASYAIDDNDETPSSSIAARSNSGRRLEKSNNVQVNVRGKYRPPPEVDFGELVESSINADRELLEKDLREGSPLVQDGEANSTDYFEYLEVVGAREMKEEEDLMLGTPTIQATGDDGMKGILNFAAMGVGGLIVLLSFVFLLRPRRRRVLFRSGKDTRAHRLTQPVDIDRDHFAVSGRAKSRAMIRGDFTDSGNSFPNEGSDFDPRGSGNSLHKSARRGPNYSVNRSYTSGAGGSSLNTSNTSGAGGLPLNTSYTSGAGGPSPNASYTSGAGGPPLNGSFVRGGVGGGFDGSSSGGRRNNSVPPLRRPRPGPSDHFAHRSMPPMGGPGSPPPGHNMGPGRGGPMNRSMTSYSRGGGRGRRTNHESSFQSSMQSGPPPNVGRSTTEESMHSSFQSGRGLQRGMPPGTRHLQDRR